MPLDIAGTGQFVKLMVKPRPSLQLLYSSRPAANRQRMYSGRAQLRRTYSRILVTKTTTTLTTPDDHVMTKKSAAGPRHRTVLDITPERINCSGSETSSSSDDSKCSVDLDELQWSSDGSVLASPPRRLRSYRQRKAKSIAEAELFIRVKERATTARTFHTWPDTISRSIESTLFSSDSSLEFQPRAPDLEMRRMPQNVGLAAMWEGRSINFDGRFEACSTVDERPIPGGRQVLQAVDRETGVVFERVYQGGEADSDDIRILNSGCSSDLSFQLVPSVWLSTSAEAHCGEAMNTQCPSMMLTLPTPVMPQSPVFVSQSPITVSKFFEAVDPPPLGTPEAQTRSLLSPAPRLASCGACGFFEFEQGLQCRDCDQQWLACKVWYRAQDGGRRRWLTAPYIRPGESTARIRALMHDVGVPGCAADADPADDTTRDEPEPVPRRPWRTLRRVRRFCRAQAVRARGILHAPRAFASAKGNTRLSCGRAAALRPLRRSRALTATAVNSTKATLARLWTTLGGYHSQNVGDGAGASCDDTRRGAPHSPGSPRAVLRQSPRCGSGGVLGAYLTQGGGSPGVRWLVPLL
ncbi:hypothetical protein PsYK624_140370 [Phanerochaete sordida]|uniref:Uncharacterized protein n=1 Tax=Phanerochaete sordida TaxID=48140 RepID=A0A9P3GQS5_9APHY|nr:hypothetical protein PsYK624_140370 [Phanerochaete sordida]